MCVILITIIFTDGQEWAHTMSQRYFQELHRTAANTAERKASLRVPLRQYVSTLKAKTLTIANSHIREFLDEVFSSEEACRFFRTLLQRFVSDSNKAGDDSLGRLAPVYALATIQRYPR